MMLCKLSQFFASFYLFAFFVIGKCNGNLETDMKFIRICNETSPISMETMNHVLINKQLSENGGNDFKCFLHCLFTNYGWMDDEGGFLLKEMKVVLDDAGLDLPALEFILYKCTSMKSVDKCERSFLFTECFWGRMKENTQEEDTYFYSIDEKKDNLFNKK